MQTNPFRANGWSADKVYTAVQQPQKTIQSAVKEENTVKKKAEPFYKPTIDISAVQLDLNLEFNADSLKSTLDNIIGKEDKKNSGEEGEQPAAGCRLQSG